MSGFFDRIKDAFGSSKKQPKFKVYETQEIKMIALRTRVILTENMEHLLKQIGAQDQKFKFISNNASETYAVLQSIGEKVIQAESIKIFVEMMRKVENNCSNIARTNGDIALMRTEMQWFQCVLWYRRAKEISKLDDFYNFCIDFFKGVDITKQMDNNCEVFKLYPILKYLKKDDVIPLAEVLFYLQPYVSCNIDKPTLDAVFQLNREDMRRSIDRASYSHPISKNKQPQKVFPNSAVITIEQSTSKRSSNPYEIQQPFIPQGNNNQIPVPYDNYKNSNIGNIQPSTNFINQNTGQYSYTGNTMNLTYNQNNSQFQQQSNPYSFNLDGGFAAQNSNYPPYNLPLPSPHVDHNPFSNSKFQPNSTINQIQQKKPLPAQTRKSFFNTLMRSNSKEQNRNASFSNNFVINDRQRQKGDFVYNEANQSYIPLNQQSYDQFNNTLNYGKDYQLQQKRKKEEQQMLKRQQQQKRRREKVEEEQRRQKQQRQKLKAQQQQRKRKEEQEYIRIKQEQAEKLAQQQQARRQREEDDRERQRQLRMRERQREEQRQLNVFVDNQRETIDRGYSGRFSSNMGFKMDFDDYQAQQFGKNPVDMNNSILRFNKQQSPVVEAVNFQEKDEADSLSFVEKGHASSSNQPFKLFYFKKNQK